MSKTEPGESIPGVLTLSGTSQLIDAISLLKNTNVRPPGFGQLKEQLKLRLLVCGPGSKDRVPVRITGENATVLRADIGMCALMALENPGVIGAQRKAALGLVETLDFSK